ncbi:hypothetical protein Tco_1507707, partial [Tanacetum coccineum]
MLRWLRDLNKDWRNEDHATVVLSMSHHVPELKLLIMAKMRRKGPGLAWRKNTGAEPVTAPANHSSSSQKVVFEPKNVPEKLNSWGSDIIASRAVGAILQKLRERVRKVWSNKEIYDCGLSFNVETPDK